MYTQTDQQNLKGSILNNILLAMSVYVNKTTLEVMQQIVEEQFVKVNMEEISTLPAVREAPVEEQNEYFLRLFVLKKKDLAKKTLDQYNAAARRLCDLTHKPLNQIDELDIDYYLRWYQNRNKSVTGKENQATTVNNERRFLSAVFTWMRHAKFIACNPVEGVEKRREERKPIDYFRPEQLEELREGCVTLRDRAIVETLRSTGARVGEIEQINRHDIDWRTGDILIRGEKGGRYRPIYLDELARYHLNKYLESRKDGEEALFVHTKRPYGRLHKTGIRAALSLIAERAGSDYRVYPHKMRKTLGMDLKKKGVDLGIIQEVLGHQDPRTTSRYYAESTSDTLRDIRRRCA